MATSVMEIVKSARQLSSAEQREVLARLWPEQEARNGRDVWVSIRFSDAMRVVAYAEEQVQFINALCDLLRQGALARLEHEADGTYEIYGSDRTYYVTMTPAREFAALLSSWPPDQPPREIELPDEQP